MSLGWRIQLLKMRECPRSRALSVRHMSLIRPHRRFDSLGFRPVHVYVVSANHYVQSSLPSSYSPGPIDLSTSDNTSG